MSFSGKNIFGLLSYRVLPLLLLVWISFVTTEHVVSFRSLFVRMPRWRLSSLPVKVLQNLSVEACAQSCVRETDFECKSFDIDNSDSSCRLQNHTHDEPFISLQISSSVDHYRTAYEKLFSRLPDHIITYNHNRKIPGVTVEQCSRRCILEVNFKCQGFDYEVNLQNCWLTNQTIQNTRGVMVQVGTDFYQRKTGGALEYFINFGYGSLRHLEGIFVYNKIMIGVTLNACAQLCYVERVFKCNSFDYVFSEMSCKMSQYIAANVHGMNNSYVDHVKIMHFEIKEEYLNYFYATPYAAVQGNNDKTFYRVTPNNCARKCLTERDFICRSFDYQIRDGTCLLGSRTGSDVGGLLSQGLAQIHHFEMKPYLDCGGLFTELTGNFASPNWPRNYAHNVYCTWQIIVPKNKIIDIEFLHFDLGPQSYDPCSTSNDRIIFTDLSHDKESVTCGTNGLRQHKSKSNNITVTFISNANHDAKGFIAFYKADWPCGGYMTYDNGEIASPNWPNSYPASTTCEWTIKSPAFTKIHLRFTSFDLEEHMTGPCNLAYDLVEIHDGYTKESKKIASLCSSGTQRTLTSSGNVLYIRFHSDERVQKNGVHAVYTFIHQTTIPPETTTSTESTSAYETSTVQLDITSAPTSESIENDTEVSLVAMFIEQKMIPPIYVDRIGDRTSSNDDNSTANDVLIGDLITGSTPDVREIPTDLRRIMLALAVAFLGLFLILVCILFFVCRYYRKRIPKRRNVPNYTFTTEESVSLYDKDNILNVKVEQEQDEEINLPQPSPSDPPADVEFCNPMYDRNNEQSQPDLDNKESSDL